MGSRSKLALELALLLLTLRPESAAKVGDGPDTGERVPMSRESASPVPIEIRGIENAFRLSPRLYSGGQPGGPESFAALRDLGVRTIVTVDGSTPDVETARKFALRYVHLPVGYDGIGRDQATRIVAAVRTMPGPVFVHCHHGMHRGPAAAALCGIANEGWSKDAADAWMRRAGTSPDYRGLFATVAEFAPPSPEELAKAGTRFPERAEIPDLVGRMIAIDGLWDRLKATRKTGVKNPGSAREFDPPHDALQLAEQFKELARDEEARAQGPDFLDRVAESARLAGGLETVLRSASKDSTAMRPEAEAAFEAVGRSCTSCHKRHRDEIEPSVPSRAAGGK